MNAGELQDWLADRIAALERPHTVRVAIDGVDAVGKTTLADALASPLGLRGRAVIRSSTDVFHNPRAVRYRRGRHDPQGYFLDSFDRTALERELLAPLGPGGSGRYRVATFDHRSDAPVESPIEVAEPGAVLLFDGLFLHRPELVRFWELSVFLDAPFEVTRARAAKRDGSPPEVDAPENRRYVEGHRIYLDRCRPAELADICVDYTDPAAPGIVRALDR